MTEQESQNAAIVRQAIDEHLDRKNPLEVAKRMRQRANTVLDGESPQGAWRTLLNEGADQLERMHRGPVVGYTVVIPTHNPNAEHPFANDWDGLIHTSEDSARIESDKASEAGWTDAFVAELRQVEAE